MCATKFSVVYIHRARQTSTSIDIIAHRTMSVLTFYLKSFYAMKWNFRDCDKNGNMVIPLD